jgi:hypothetical protein
MVLAKVNTLVPGTYHVESDEVRSLTAEQKQNTEIHAKGMRMKNTVSVNKAAVKIYIH